MGEGWQTVPPGDEPAIRSAWAAHLQPADALVIHAPSRSWRGQALARHRPSVETEFSGKLLAAFRRCTRPGERLWVIDWQHAWYSLDPHAAAGERPVPALPDGDSYNYVAPDFRFGLVMGWRDTGPVTLFGADLLSAFAVDPPAEFLRVCGPGEFLLGQDGSPMPPTHARSTMPPTHARSTSPSPRKCSRTTDPRGSQTRSSPRKPLAA